jgi:hypothetical protein
LTTGRGRADASFAELLHTIQGRVIAASFPGFTIVQRAVAAAKPAKSQSRDTGDDDAGDDGSVAIMIRSRD